MAPEKELCGTRPCTEVVNGLGKVLGEQQDKGFTSVKELMNAHHEAVKESIAEIKQTIKDQGDEIFPRLRSVEERVTVIERMSMTDEKVKDIIAADEKIIGWEKVRKRTALLGNSVFAGLILAFLLWVASLFKFKTN